MVTVYLPLVAMEQPRIRLAALYYDSETTNEPDEAFRLWNISDDPVDLAGYGVGDGRRTVTFPSMMLAAGTGLWCTGDALAFTRSYGFSPDCEYGADSDPQVPNLNGTALRFANTGGQALLFNPSGGLVDVVVYEGGDAAQPGWQGPAVDPYTPSNTFPADGQILYRKFDWRYGPTHPRQRRPRRLGAGSGRSSTAAGGCSTPAGTWSASPDQRVISASGVLTVALGPDNLFDLVSQTLASAQHSIRLASFTIEHMALADLLAAKASSGVAVSILLEGAPAGGHLRPAAPQ
jgi:hypothetical protein